MPSNLEKIMELAAITHVQDAPYHSFIAGLNARFNSLSGPLGQAQFLRDLHDAKNRNLRWKLIAEAPSGFCHPRSSMIATLLDDIKAGVSFEVARKKWNKQMHPLQYQRAQVAPTAGAVKAAEEAFAKLGAGPALRRRYATMADILETTWTPKFAEAAAPAASLFGNIKTKEATAAPASMKLPPVTMTWARFVAEVLPGAEKIESLQSAFREQYATLVTADVTDALPILQWDNTEFRNPVSAFAYHGGSRPADFMLAPGWVVVKLVTPLPFLWSPGDFSHHGAGALLVLEGARDTGKGHSQSAIFADTLKSEFHAYRSVIEAYSKSNPLLGWEAEHVAGQMVLKGTVCNLALRVNAGGIESEYRIDRWE